MQLLWLAPQSADATLSWSSYVWRRGTVPIWWGVEIKSGGVGEATIVVSADRPYNGTKRSAHAQLFVCIFYHCCIYAFPAKGQGASADKLHVKDANMQ